MTNAYSVSIYETRPGYSGSATPQPRYCTGNESGFGAATLEAALEAARSRVQSERDHRDQKVADAIAEGKPVSYIEHLRSYDYVIDVRLICPACSKRWAAEREAFRTGETPKKYAACKVCRVPSGAGKQRRKWWSPGTLPLPFIPLEDKPTFVQQETGT